MANRRTVLPTLDHIVILVSHKTLQELPDRLHDVFTVITGGEHADGLTFNMLVLFQDGVYIEFIAFHDDIDPERRKNHRWVRQEEGAIIDWAYTLPHESDFAQVQERVASAGAGITYNDPVSGGRVKPDGTVLKWAVATGRYTKGDQRAADVPTPPGMIPFWCLDRTPRNLRVPYEGNDETQHPSGARGVSRLSICVPPDERAEYRMVYGAIHSSAATGAESDGWHFIVPSGSSQGTQRICLIAGQQESLIKLTLLGGKTSPASVELLPGLVVEFENFP